MPSATRLDPSLHRRLVDSLYTEAMIMADEARAYFEASPTPEMSELAPLQRVAFTSESLKVTTRLMHVIAWLLSQRAWQRGEIGIADIADEKYRLGDAHRSDGAVLAAFPCAARALVEGSEELYGRVFRLQRWMLRASSNGEGSEPGHARALIDRLQTAF